MSTYLAVGGITADQRNGATTWWRLSGITRTGTLHGQWAAAGLPPSELPAAPTPYAALRRALLGLAAPHTLIRPLRGERQGYAVVTETYCPDGSPEYTLAWEAWIDPQEDLVTSNACPVSDAARLSTAYHTALWQYSDHDISSWLVQLVRARKAVPLRDSGGIYFIPRDEMAAWTTRARAIERASAHTVYELPVVRSEEAVKAVLASVQAEATRAIAQLEEVLATDPSARKAAGQQQYCAQVRDLVATYEGLLGAASTGVRESLDELEARFAQIALAKVRVNS